eukprot:522820_1
MPEFSCMIFNHLHQKWKNQTQNGLQINTINHAISNIVSQRQMNDTETDSEDGETVDKSSQPIQTDINHLTDVLIQEIASYLPFRSYSNLQSCCRSIFHAANTPSTLYALDDNIDLDACINTENEHQIKSFMKRFERVQRLAIGITAENEKYIHLIHAQFKNVKHLKLYYIDNIESYVFNWNKIRILDIAQEIPDALAIVKRCKNLSTIVLDAMEDEHNQLAELVGGRSDLQCLVLQDEASVDTRVILKNICNSLQSLTILNQRFNVDGMTFHSLRELCVEWPEQDSHVMSIINGTKHLKRLGMVARFFANLDDVKYYKLAFRTIFEMNALEYIYIRCSQPQQFSLITHLIETSFHKKRHRFRLKITVYWIRFAGTCPLGSQEIYEATVRLFNALSNWCTHFMFILEIHSPGDKPLNALNQWLEDISNVFSVQKCIVKRQQRIIISNKCNVFNGYEERLIAPFWK